MQNLTIPAELLAQATLDELLLDPTSTKLSQDVSVLLDRIKETGKEHKLLTCNQPVEVHIGNTGLTRQWYVYDGLKCLLWHFPHIPLSYFARSVAQEAQHWLNTGTHRQFVLASDLHLPMDRAAMSLQHLSRHTFPHKILGEVAALGGAALHVSGSALEQKLAESRGRFYYLFQSHLPPIPTPLNLLPDLQVQNPMPQIVPTTAE